MSKSYRDQRPAQQAARRLGVISGKEKPLPRIIVRKPRDGDIHPMEIRVLKGAIQLEVPLEYLYGISRIELRPRKSGPVGSPFGFYSPVEKAITLYSLPLRWAWQLAPRPPSKSILAGMSRFGARLDFSAGTEVQVSWPSRQSLALWFFFEVVCHELGHHFRNQYKIRNGNQGRRNHEEWMADVHAYRIEHQAYERRQSVQSESAPLSAT